MIKSIYHDRFFELVEKWKAEASTRKVRTPSDPAAETMESCGRDLAAVLDEIDHDTAWLTPTQYGELHHVRPQTVTRWIRESELAAEETPNGYLIARDAVRTPKLKSAKTSSNASAA